MLEKALVAFDTVTKELKNEKTGESRTFTLRPYREGDEQGMIACIRGEYGDSYFKRDFYDAEKLRHKALGDSYVFFVAESEGVIAGMEIFALFHEYGDDFIEPASQILRTDMRGYGLASELVEYTFRLAKAMKPSALFVHAVTFHDITQHVCGGQGMQPTGFRLGSFMTSRMQNSYPKGRCPKHSEGIMILPVEKRAAGTVYVPKELTDTVRDCYDRLQMSFELCNDKADYKNAQCELSEVTDELQRTVLISVHAYGADLAEQVQRLMQQHTEPYWTYQITLSASDGQLLTAYEQLKQLGFFFTGVKAACGDTEQIYMQWCGDLELYMEDYVLTEEFARMRERIRNLYDRRIGK